jgi:site-specific DNA-cytosine methylase
VPPDHPPPPPPPPPIVASPALGAAAGVGVDAGAGVGTGVGSRGAGSFVHNPHPLPRFFTPREAARLMGFPDSFKIQKKQKQQQHRHRKYGQKAPQPPPSIYHELGNAVVPPVIEAIGRRMLLALGIIDDNDGGSNTDF